MTPPERTNVAIATRPRPSDTTGREAYAFEERSCPTATGFRESGVPRRERSGKRGSFELGCVRTAHQLLGFPQIVEGGRIVWLQANRCAEFSEGLGEAAGLGEHDAETGVGAARVGASAMQRRKAASA